MRFRAVVGSLLGGLALALVAAGPALAEDPVDLGSSPVLDVAGVLDSPGAAETAIDDAFDRTGVSLFVVLVGTFDSPSDADDWAAETAERNGLGVGDVLLAIAVEDRNYTWNAEADTLSDAQLDAMSTRVEARLADDDWDGAVVEAANALGDQLGGGGIPVLPLALGGVAVVGIGALVVRGVVKRRKGAADAPVGQLSQKDLDTRAGSLLVQLDDAVKTSEQELGFAVAQFGEKATAEFATALARAQSQVKEAFELRHRLDDASPEPAADKRAMTLRIIELTETADATLDAQAEAFEQLRQLEANAPKILEQVAEEHAGLAARIEAADATVAQLTTTYGQPAVASVSGNVPQATKLAAFAGAALDEARAALARPDTSAAAIAVRGAQQTVGQIGQLLAAIDKVAVDLPALGERLEAATDDTRADIAEARAAEGTAESLTPAITEAERVLTEAAGQDPATALAAIERTNTALNQALSTVRDQQAQVARATAQLGRVTAEAQGAVEAARDFITTRRGAVGATARTRLAEAEKLLTHALALTATDAVAALGAAQQSASLARSALDMAGDDVTSFGSPSYGGSPFDGLSGGYSGGYSGDSGRYSGGDVGGAILGGILEGLFSGSSSGRSGRSSGGWSRPGGFGGSGSRPRPSGGSGRPSRSSGRRSRGGRF